MSFFDRIAAIHRWTPETFRPFRVDGVQVGRVRHDLAPALADYPDVLRVDGTGVELAGGLGDVDARSRALHEVAADLARRGAVPDLRGEVYGISECWGRPPRLWLDRGVVPAFGVRSHGVHVNGYVERNDGLHIWVGRRAPDKRVAPAKLDHLVAGGLAYGDSARATLIREADEEAALPEALARQATAVGALSYICEGEGGLRDDVLFIYDLVMPESVTPENRDGEIVAFSLWPAADVLARVRDTADFKFNVAPVLIDFFIRHGFCSPDSEPDLPELARALHAGPAV